MQQPPEPTPREPEDPRLLEPVASVYQAVAINHLPDEDDEMKDLKQRMFDKLSGKHYTSEEIEDMGDVTFMNMYEAFRWEERRHPK